ncbi:MAG: hypothetical protein BMS9Abin04_445 [Planctomycetia bacterium]|nr:MAG: hypothetical protein BMS9Abin04_445 [Planctomycetia bacterium]
MRRTVYSALGEARAGWRRRTLPLLTLPLVLCSVGRGLCATEAPATAVFDWPNWRGPQQNRTSRETGLIDQWDPKGGPGNHLLWKSAALAGRSTPIVMGGKLYLMARSFPRTSREGEKVVCADAVTGKILWENRFNVYLSDVPAERVGWASCAGDPATGRVYALGVCGRFLCLDGQTGQTIWSHTLHEEYGLLSTYGGRTNSPVVFEGLVIVSAIVIGWGETAKPAHRFLAFDKQTGEIVWFRGTRPLPYDTTYSTPTMAVLGGQAAMVFGSGDGAVWALQPRTGAALWHYKLSRRGLNVSPLVVGQMVYAGHGEENLTGSRMGALVAIDGTGRGDLTGKQSWRLEEIMVGRSSPVPVNNHLLAVDNGAKLFLLDPDSGKTIFRRPLGGAMFSTPLVADGKIYLCTENRHWYILRPQGDRIEVVHRVRMPQGEGCYGSPIVAGGRIYVPTTGQLYCFGRPDATPSATTAPAPARQPPASPDDKPAYVRVVPCELLLRPGGQRKLAVRVFNQRGQRLDGARLQCRFSLVGPGQLAADGTYRASAANRHEVAIVEATVAEVSGQARIRVAPDPPWQVDFDDGQIPVNWVGARYRHVPLDFDLFEQLKQQDALAAQLYIYLRSLFVNSGRPQLTFRDGPRRRTWTALVRALHLESAPNSLPAARQVLDRPLKRLADVGIVGAWQWGHAEDEAVSLVVDEGARRIDGNGVMVKITTIPKGTRSRCWFGRSDLRDYTIQADVLGATHSGKMPDIGLIDQGYVLDMQGASQKLQIRSWSPQLRMATTVDYPWQPDVWYTMKLQTSVENDVARVRGKVWRRGEREPGEWTVVATDPVPNRSGSPGLFGNANDAEIFLDDVTVTPNE